MLFILEAIDCLYYEDIFITGHNYPYGKIKLLELCEWTASQILFLKICQNIVNMIRETHWILWDAILHSTYSSMRIVLNSLVIMFKTV